MLANPLTRQREDLQPVFSFKLRGAYNKIVSTPIADLERGVVACSAGNHAQVSWCWSMWQRIDPV